MDHPNKAGRLYAAGGVLLAVMPLAMVLANRSSPVVVGLAALAFLAGRWVEDRAALRVHLLTPLATPLGVAALAFLARLRAELVRAAAGKPNERSPDVAVEAAGSDGCLEGRLSTCCRSLSRRSGTCSPVSFLPLPPYARCCLHGRSGDDDIRPPHEQPTFELARKRNCSTKSRNTADVYGWGPLEAHRRFATARLGRRTPKSES